MSEQQLTRVLVQIARSIVMPAAVKLVSEVSSEPQPHVELRAGSGARTCYSRHIPRGSRTMKHSITFGQKMVESKRCKQKSAGWTTGKEILNRKYYNGELSFPHLMAHTVLHEVAHYHCIALNGRDRGEVHTPEFYDSLSLLHAHCGKEALAMLMSECAKKGISLDFSSSLSDQPLLTASSFEKGKTYAFESKGRLNLIQALRVNSKTVGGRYLNGPKAGREVRVPFSMLRSASAEEASLSPKAPAPAPAPTRRLSGGHFRIGESYALTIDGAENIVKALKVNQKTVKGRVIKGPKTGNEYRIPFSMLRSAA